MSYELKISTAIHFGEKSLEEIIPPEGSILLVAGSSVNQIIIDTLIKRWSQRNVETVIFRRASGEPNSAEVDMAFAQLPRVFSAIIALGGGSVIDFAKALSVLFANGGAIAEYEFGYRKILGALPLYAVPTTCGSGSEVTPYAVINNSQTKRKFTLNHLSLIPVCAAVNPSLLSALPRHQRLATALDAFTHCLEALLNKQSNRLIEPIANEGLALGWRLLPEALTENPKYELFEGLARMSLYGGISISHSRTGLVHTLSAAFAKFSDLPHGLLNAVLLPYAVRYSLKNYNGQLAKIIEKSSGKSLTNDAEALLHLENFVVRLMDIPPPAISSEIYPITVMDVVNRVLQDSGLSEVTYGPINEIELASLIGEIIDEVR